MAYLALFEVAGRALALPAEALVTVADPVPVTRLPFVGDDVEGMVAVGGAIIAQIDLGRRLGLPPSPALPAALMLVRINGRQVALRVAGVLTKAEVDEREILPPANDDGPLVQGVFLWHERRVSLLRLERLGLDGLTPVAIGRPVALLGEIEQHPRAGKVSVAADPGLSVLAVRCGAAGYALPAEQVHEVVTVEELTRLPHAPPEIRGLAVVRKIPRLVLSLGRLLGLPDSPPAKGNFVPMVLVQRDNRCFALAVDAIAGLRRLETAGLHLLAAPQGGLAGYHLGSAQALTGLIDLDSLLAGTAERLLAFLPGGGGGAASARACPEPERRFLTFQIGGETFGIDIDRVERIAEHRAPLPLPGKRHAALAGMVEIAGRVVPVADLRRPLGRPVTVTRRTALVLARGSRGVWALVVDRLVRIVRIPVSAIRAASAGQHFIGEIARLDRSLMPIVDPLALDSIAA